MRIKQITLNNFRIYRDANTIVFPESDGKNVHIVSGFNGFGKTTFLTSLVWCLYGKSMQMVDASFKERIIEAGGYKLYLRQCINRMAKASWESEYFVEIILTDIAITGTTVNEVTVRRKVSGDTEKLTILIDGKTNELVEEVGNEIFIHDFILPKEIAKFFFFDAEKITSIAEIKTLEEKRHLSRAYSEVLGIKKYEDLKNNLSDLRIRYRQKSASKQEKEKLNKLSRELKSLKCQREESESKIEQAEEERELLKKKSDALQEKLIREGNTISPDKYREMKWDQAELIKRERELKLKFKGLLDLAPFAIASKLFYSVGEQLENESNFDKYAKNKKDLEKKLKKVKETINDFDRPKVAVSVKEFYSNRLDTLLKSTFKDDLDSKSKMSMNVLHGYSEEENAQYNSISQQISGSYKAQIKELVRDLKLNSSRLFRIKNEILKATSKVNDVLIESIRNEKDQLDAQFDSLWAYITEHTKNIGSFENQFNTVSRLASVLQRKIKVGENYVKKDEVSERLVITIDAFIRNIKEKKRAALEVRIKDTLNQLMHKKNFIKEVHVLIANDIVDIELVDHYGDKISKDDLSKGEQQLYATSILKALVDESNIQFPVFIDSPLQKLDANHSKSILAQFYPSISKQVVILPLLNKELNKEEFKLIEDKVGSAHVIKNNSKNNSSFVETPINKLFTASKKELINV